MIRKSIFETERPDVKIMRFDTPSENETQLDEDKFENQVLNHFKNYRFLCEKRIKYMALQNMENGDIVDRLKGICRAYILMKNISSDIAEKVSKGYKRVN